jgi:2-C-methyl-D-erythritol 2,4-cyclodiphosphate synthase
VTDALSERVGLGIDSHRFASADADRPLILGGVTIPDQPGLEGHSDADVLTHALIDALLGAAGLGDIGQHFPSDDETWAGADSVGLLTRTVAMLREHSYGVGNVDAVIVAERPRLRPYIGQMEERLAVALSVDAGAVNIKATTAEQMGALGRAEGIQAQAIVRIVADR